MNKGALLHVFMDIAPFSVKKRTEQDKGGGGGGGNGRGDLCFFFFLF